LIPVIDHALLVVAFTGQAFISSDIDRGIWFTGLVQEPVEIGIVFQASIINFMRGGIQRSIPRIKILRRYGFAINEFRDTGVNLPADSLTVSVYRFLAAARSSTVITRE
jgi:hypothetical protein